jgi:hypothetical protein
MAASLAQRPVCKESGPHGCTLCHLCRIAVFGLRGVRPSWLYPLSSVSYRCLRVARSQALMAVPSVTLCRIAAFMVARSQAPWPYSQHTSIHEINLCFFCTWSFAAAWPHCRTFRKASCLGAFAAAWPHGRTFSKGILSCAFAAYEDLCQDPSRVRPFYIWTSRQPLVRKLPSRRPCAYVHV